MVDRLAGVADTVVRNARVYTVNKGRPWAEALAVTGDRITFVGDDGEADGFIGVETKVIDAKGRMVLPGFIDSHVHFASGFLEESWVELSEAKSIDEIGDVVARHAQQYPERKLVGGYGWKYEAVLRNGEYPTKHDLDEMVRDRHLILQSYDGWVLLANSRFTDLIERSAEGRPFVPKFERDDVSGEATGVFLDSSILETLGGEVYRLSREGFVSGVKHIVRKASSMGVTSVHDAMVTVEDLDAFCRLRDEDSLQVRLYCAMQYHRSATDEDLQRLAELRERCSDEFVRVGAVKLFIDGVLESHTAAMLEPYCGQSGDRGELKFDSEQLKDIVARLDELGFQCIIHSCGDRGVRTSLDAFEEAQTRNGRRDSRHRIEHIETISATDIPRFRELSVIASMQPEHVVTDPKSTYFEAAGADRLRDSFPWRRLRREGAVLAFSSDWPVASLNPLSGIQAALTRESEPGHERTVTLEEAIESYTINGAYASFEERIKGSIEPGKLADLIVLSDNLFDTPHERISQVEVLLTMLGGRETYRSQRL